jgi:hypothetical protein
MALSAAVLLVVSFEPWSGFTRDGGSERTFSAWANRRWSEAVLLGLLAALLIAYRARNPRGAAGVALAMLALGLGLAAWEWRHPNPAAVTEFEIATLVAGNDPEAREATLKALRRQYEEAVAAGAGVEYPTSARWGFFAGSATMALMLVTAIRLFRAAPASMPESHG